MQKASISTDFFYERFLTLPGVPTHRRIYRQISKLALYLSLADPAGRFLEESYFLKTRIAEVLQQARNKDHKAFIEVFKELVQE